MQDNNKLVFPGDLLGTEEEFLSGKGTFEKDGNIYSKLIGFFSLDKLNHSAIVIQQTVFPEFQKIGDVVLGEVFMVRDKMVMVDLIASKKENKRTVPHNATAILRVSDIDKRFVESAKKEFMVGDVVKVKIKDLNPFTVNLTTSYPELGVIKGYCSKCKHELRSEKNSGSKLKCSSCGRFDNRKVSTDYGFVSI